MPRSISVAFLAVAIVILAPMPDHAVGAELLLQDVPAYEWTKGCSPTAGMMVMGYWDNCGYVNLIPGSSLWDENSGAIKGAIASGGHTLDYAWYDRQYDSEGSIIPDMSEIDPGGAHADDCLADFMGTSRSALGLWYGATSSSRIGPGMEAYASWRGYGFTAAGDWSSIPSWLDLTHEIRMGRPVVLGVDSSGDGNTDHSVTAIGFRDTSGYQEYACRDAWSSDYHDIRWARFRPVLSGDSWGVSGWDALRPPGWTGDTAWKVGNGDWHASSSWDSGVPSGTVFAYIPEGGQAAVSSPAAAQFINNYGQVTVSNSLQAGTIRNTGTIHLPQVNSSLTVPRVLRNFGTITQDAGRVDVPGSVFIHKDASYSLRGGLATLENLEINRGGRFEWLGGVLITQDIKGNLDAEPYTDVRPALAIGFDFNPHDLTSGALYGGSSFSIGEIGLVEITGGGQATQTYGSVEFRLMRIGGEPGDGTYVISGAESNLAYRVMELGDGGHGYFRQVGGYVGRDSDGNWGGNIYLGSKPGSVGIYEIEDGELATYRLDIGTLGKGIVKQTGGTVTLLSAMMSLGCTSGGEGIYEMSGGQLSLPIDDMNVGYDGKGLFQQSGGTVEVGDILVGYNRSAIGSYELSVGEVIVGGYVHVGYYGVGLFRQTGGTSTVGGRVSLGSDYGSQGTYELINGDLSSHNVTIGGGRGSGGVGLFEQSGGVLTIQNSLTLAGLEGSHGTYRLNAGQLSTASIRMGCEGTGLFIQNGGTLSVAQSLNVGRYGYFELNGGVLNVGTFCFARGVMNVAGGSASIDTLQARGEVNQNGGTLSVLQSMDVKDSGCFELNGGVLDVANSCLVEGVMNLAGGSASFDTLDVEGEVNVETPDCHLVVSGQLDFGGGGRFSAVPGSTIHMTGAAFKNTSRDPSNLAGLANLTLVFEGGAGVPDDFEVAGANLGLVPAGWTDNFVLGALQLGGAADGCIRLVDSSDNQQDGPGNEALYVDWLVLNPGATIDFNNLNLYFLNGGLPKQLFHGDVTLDGCVDGLDYVVWSSHYGSGPLLDGDANLDDVVNGLDYVAWSNHYLMGGVGLEEGDFNGDGVADGLDYIVWSNHYRAVAMRWGNGDLTGDRAVNGLDYIVWSDNYLAGRPGAAGPVPEPAAVSLLAFGIIGLLRRKRR